MASRRLHRTLSALLLFVIVLASTGFTTVLQYCSMSRSSTCCCGSMSDGVPHHAAGLSISEEGFSCNSKIIAGGLNKFDGLVASSTSTSDVTSGGEAEAPLAMSVVLPQQGMSLVVSHHPTLGPPGAEIYIQIRSLLI